MPDRDAILYQGQSISYAALADRVVRTAGWLQAQGIGPGDVVALLMRNSPAYLELAIAVSHAGAVLLPINFRLSADEIAFICGNAGARLLICDDDLGSGASAVACQVRPIDASIQANSSRLAADDAQGRFVPPTRSPRCRTKRPCASSSSPTCRRAR